MALYYAKTVCPHGGALLEIIESSTIQESSTGNTSDEMLTPDFKNNPLESDKYAANNE